MNTAAIAFSLILTIFTPSHDGGQARADVWVLDHGLTAEDCMAELSVKTPDQEALPSGQVLSCTIDQDF